MWLILIDRSPSMFQPFEGTPIEGGRGRVRRTRQETRWATAKEALLADAASLGDEALTIVAFDNSAELVFEGSAHEQERIRETLERLEEGDGTDVSGALAFASKVLDRRPGELTNVEVISDCQDDESSAAQTARALGQRVGMIEVILIDPSPGGAALAAAIAIRGRVTRVHSVQDLGQATHEAATRHVEENARIEVALAHLAAGRLEVLASVDPEQRLVVSVGYPGACEISAWYDFQVILHIPSRSADALARLGASTASRGLNARKGQWLELTPRGAGLAFEPASREVAWVQDLQEVGFQISVLPGAAGRRQGALAVHAEGLLVAEVPFELTVRRKEEAAEEEIPRGVASKRMFESIFASYAYEDLAIVKRCAAAYRALGIELLVDYWSLRSGEEWLPALFCLIERADIFQLYWSQHARSKHVEAEWVHALSISDRKANRFLRPLYWERPLPDPDPRLAHLHFAYLDLDLGRSATFEAAEHPAASTPAPATAAGAIEPSFEEIARRATSISSTVIPLVPGETRRSQGNAREQVATATSYLEAMTGLRYYPPPTLLVDEVIVHRARSKQRMVDTLPEEAVVDPLAAGSSHKGLVEILQPLLLEYHKGHVPPVHEGWPRVLLDLSPTSFLGIHEFAEWSLRTWIDPPRPSSNALRATLEAFANYLGRDGFAAHRSVSFRIAWRTSSDPSAPDPRSAWEAVRDLEGWSSLQHDRIPAPRGGRRGTDPKDDWGYEIRGHGAAVVAAARAAVARLLARMHILESATYADAAGCSAEAWQVIGDATMLEACVRELWGRHDPDGPVRDSNLASQVNGLLYPSWRRVRDWLFEHGVVRFDARQGFEDVIDLYLELMLALFRYGEREWPGFEFQSQYRIAVDAWSILPVPIPDGLTARRVRESIELCGPFSSFVDLFERCSRVLVKHLRRASVRRGGRATLDLLVRASTYGVFVPAKVVELDGSIAARLVAYGLDSQLSLPGTDRVLFCAKALGGLGQSVDERMFSTCVLVHEHFHGIAALGLEADGGAVSRREGWEDATPLNEALAVWMELHYLDILPRTSTAHEATREAVWAYIHAGEYPAWPYRGAAAIERLYQSKGIAAVRELVNALRRDARKARADFDDMNRVLAL